MSEQYKIKSNGIDEQIKLYGKDSNEAQALIKKKTDLEQQYHRDILQLDERELQRKHASIAIELQMAYEKKKQTVLCIMTTSLWQKHFIKTKLTILKKTVAL